MHLPVFHWPHSIALSVLLPFSAGFDLSFSTYPEIEEGDHNIDEWQDGNNLHIFHPSHVYNDSLVAANFKNILEEGSDFMALNTQAHPYGGEILQEKRPAPDIRRN